MSNALVHLTDREILDSRSAKNAVDPFRPYAYFVEPEHTAEGRVEDVATIFLTNRECPFRCLMCDLWKNTTDERVPVGAIPQQIDFALSQLPAAQHIKLYNSGNFFDVQAIPPKDHESIAQRVGGFRTVIVESHPKLCDARCIKFRDRLMTDLEIAIGLETIHPEISPALNKQMTLADFQRAADLLLENDIAVRSFILLKTPWMSESEGIDWAIRSIEYSFSLGVGCCSVIPTRAGNGIMDQLAAGGQFEPPRLSSMERVLEEGLRLGKGRVFVDLWDAHQFSQCRICESSRIDRLRQMNLMQQVLPPVSCDCGTAA